MLRISTSRCVVELLDVTHKKLPVWAKSAAPEGATDKLQMKPVPEKAPQKADPAVKATQDPSGGSESQPARKEPPARPPAIQLSSQAAASAPPQAAAAAPSQIGALHLAAASRGPARAPSQEAQSSAHGPQVVMRDLVQI